MKNHIPTFTNTSEWERNVYANTGGTRSKTILIHPDSQDQYFYKGSKELDSGEFRYPTEFWSEIVSSKIGQLFGFDMLDYNIAYNANFKQKVGCLSKSMVNNSINKLTEGKEYLIGFDGKYDPDLDKKDYTFQFISDALVSFGIENYLKNIAEIIVFDALIGNSDRHQENWAIITNFEKTIQELDNDLKNNSKHFLKKFWTRIKLIIAESQAFLEGERTPDKKKSRSTLILHADLMKHDFSPIYDSGCCLGREILDDKVKLYLSAPQRIEKYVKKGTSEIHWEGDLSKKNHFELVKLVQQEHPKFISAILNRVKDNFNREKIKQIVEGIDTNLPENLKEHKLSVERKQLMINLITLRAEKLMQL